MEATGGAAATSLLGSAAEVEATGGALAGVGLRNLNSTSEERIISHLMLNKIEI